MTYLVAANMATEQVIRVSNVKIERKFVPTPLLQAQLDGKYGEFERLRRDQGGQAAAQQSSKPITFQ